MSRNGNKKYIIILLLFDILLPAMTSKEEDEASLDVNKKYSFENFLVRFQKNICKSILIYL